MFYSLLLYLHIFSIILSMGPFFILFPLIGKMKASEAAVLESQIGFFRSAVRLSMHAGHLLVVTGILLYILGPYGWNTSWIIITIILLVSVLFFFARAFSPTLRKLREQDGSGRDALIVKLRRSLYWYVGALMVMMWFMVAKPSLW